MYAAHGIMPSQVAAQVRAEHNAPKTSVEREVPDTLGQAWRETLGYTAGTAKFYASNKRFKWTSRLIMFPLIFILCPVHVVGTLFLLWCAWRFYRMAVVLSTRMTTRKAQKAAQRQESASKVKAQAKRVRRIRFEIKIG